jgi:hypothetical protein
MDSDGEESSRLFMRLLVYDKATVPPLLPFRSYLKENLRKRGFPPRKFTTQMLLITTVIKS